MVTIKYPIFTSVRVRGKKAYAVLHKKIQDDQPVVSQLLRPEDDFLYEPRSKEQHLNYIESLSKSHASKKV